MDDHKLRGRTDRLTGDGVPSLFAKCFLHLRVVRVERYEALLERLFPFFPILREFLRGVPLLLPGILLELRYVVGVGSVAGAGDGVVCIAGVEDACVPMEDASEEDADTEAEDAGDGDGNSEGSVDH